ncbi:hypothetical protein WICMUC_000801 [Wickerhamomyces mucosus]|uniref:DASH complex subunit ASK1 n=1 Tax=Wickerhamomyces mucosus TaxID=1378264 RepID=A0A9P8PWJ7_9ASCO|nr:hypothetical protein WICMUC_000801 [Wickerhamomyces mucosus]
MHRKSVLPSNLVTSNSSRRKSVFTSSINATGLNEASSQAIELERLEQEITLTLQHIDKSFAKSHKIINEKLIPIVNKYHSNSKRIWQGVNFWKNFLENSANVELKGYEEAVKYQQELDGDVSNNKLPVSNQNTVGNSQESEELLNESLSPVKIDQEFLESTNHTTINQFQKRYQTNFNPIMPAIQSSQRPLSTNQNLDFDTTDSILPSLPQIDQSQSQPPTQTETQSHDFLIHEGPDINYKVSVTPKKTKRQYGFVNSVTPKNKKRKSMIAQKYDSSPFEIETPKLHSDVRFSPTKPKTPEPSQVSDQNKDGQTQRFPNTPKYKVQKIVDDSVDISIPETVNFKNQVIKRTPTRDVAKTIVQEILTNVSGIDDSTMEKNQFNTALEISEDTEQNKDVGFDEFLDKPVKTKGKDLDWSDE